MNYLKELTKEEWRYICSVVPFRIAADYFKRYPKKFAKLRPGFRVKSLTVDAMEKTLYDFRNTNFVGSFLGKVIDEWIREIDEEIKKNVSEGMNQESAYIDVLSQSYFSDKISLYFKIKNIEKSEEYLTVLGAAVFYQSAKIKTDYKDLFEMKKEMSGLEIKLEDLENQFSEREKTIVRLRKNNSELKKELDEQTVLAEENQDRINRLSELNEELNKKLKHKEEESARVNSSSIQRVNVMTAQAEEYQKKIAEYEARADDYSTKLDEYKKKIVVLEGEMEEFEAQSEKSEKRITQLILEKNTQITKNSVLQSEIQELEAKLENTTKELVLPIEENRKSKQCILPLHPVDMDDFDEHFSYNLSNIGFNKTLDGARAFVVYLKKIVFDGIPLLIKRGLGINLANCLSNTLYGETYAEMLSYSNGLGIQKIRDFLSSSDARVVCIDGFIGNCNEIELMSVLEQYRNKIIIITYMFDKTLRYIPPEILSYVRFVCADEFSSLLKRKDITEEPSTIEEEAYTYQKSFPNNRYQKIFREIVQQCGLNSDISNTLADEIDDEKHMNNLLMFTLLPYLTKVLGISPYNCSKRLQKYAGETGRCPNKEILMRWFG